MNCFVIMPYAKEFDDVYTHIKMSVEAAVGSQSARCFRLDEARPAGRITDRLLAEIHASTLCVADITGLKPNIMWEVGYAMALGKPTIIATQDVGDLPFDIKDMHNINYDRNHLSSTLGIHLRRAVIDTLNTLPDAAATSVKPDSSERESLVGELLEEVRDLKTMLSQAVKTWRPPPLHSAEALPVLGNYSGLDGAWINTVSGSHYYAKVVNDELVVPYCYRGNEELTAVYYGWKQTGEYWFARFRWLGGGFSGFCFLRQDTLDRLSGAWWSDSETSQIPESPELGFGVPTHWERNKDPHFPDWAQHFLQEVQREGLVCRLTRS